MQVVLVTGASSGLGQATAMHLAGRGYRVYGTSRRPQEYPPPEAFDLIRLDVNDEESVRQGVALVLEREGRLDAVVNNAGLGYGGAVEDSSLEEAHAQFETNFFGTLRVCREVLPVMREQGGGTIINISSIGGRIALPFQGLYSAAKFAIEGLSEALRMEVRPFGIHVVLVEPSDFCTNFTTRRVRTRASGEGSAYREAFERTLQVIEHDERHGSPPELVARTVERILRSRSPRLRYVVGSFDQRLAAALKGLLPGRLFEWIIRSHYRV